MKKESTKLVIWAVVALVVGVIIGLLVTNVTTGNAKKITNQPLTAKQVEIINKLNQGLNPDGTPIVVPDKGTWRDTKIKDMTPEQLNTCCGQGVLGCCWYIPD